MPSSRISSDHVALRPVTALQNGPDVRGRLARSGPIRGRWSLVWSWFTPDLSVNGGSPVATRFHARWLWSAVATASDGAGCHDAPMRLLSDRAAVTDTAADTWLRHHGSRARLRRSGHHGCSAGRRPWPAPSVKPEVRPSCEFWHHKPLRRVLKQTRGTRFNHRVAVHLHRARANCPHMVCGDSRASGRCD
jgi:hypothetical protein